MAIANKIKNNAAWTFDGNGNRMNQTTATSSVAYAIATSSNRMDGADARSFGFDALGNITADSGNGIAYHFDPFNRMDSSTRAGVTTTYHVDPLGRRTSKATAGGSWTRFVYAPDGALQAENGPAGATDYLWLGGSLVGMVRNGAIYAIHTDQLGRPELVTDPNRNIVWRASNFAYDRTVTQDNIGGLNVGFPGQYYDIETGLWNNGFRDYDASVGRYVESDPLGLAAGVNTYAYTNSNPVSRTDPLGLCDQKPNCNTVLPNGQTIGQVVQNAVSTIQFAASYDLSGLSKMVAFVATVGSRGPIDFKNNMGPDTTGVLGADGNFAYGAIASGIGYSLSFAELGAGAYALEAGKSNLNNPYGEDNSAAQNLPAGYATTGCTH